MKKRTQFNQCTLRRPNADQSTTTVVSYIPAKFSKIGNALRLRSDNGLWTDGWIVQMVGDSISEQDLPDSHLATKRHRQATGDATRRPKR